MRENLQTGPIFLECPSSRVRKKIYEIVPEIYEIPS